MFPEHVEQSFLDPRYSFDKYFQLGSRTTFAQLRTGLSLYLFSSEEIRRHVAACFVTTARLVTKVTKRAVMPAGFV